MTHTVTLFAIPGDPDSNRVALQTIGSIPNVKVEIVSCPHSSREWFIFPFVRDEEGIPYYGLEGIKSFTIRRTSCVG